MNRWNFFSGLTVILLLLLVLSGYCVWITRALTSDIDTMIAGNFDTIRCLRDMRTSVARIDAQYRTASQVEDVNRSMRLYELEKQQLSYRLDTVKSNAHTSGEMDEIARLEAILQDYFKSYEEYFALKPKEEERFKTLLQTLGHFSAQIADLSSGIMETNEKAIFNRRAVTMESGRRASVVSLGIALFSLAIYIFTSIRLTQGVFRPLREMRDAIVQVGRRKFDTIVPIKGSEEVAQIVATFNQMAGELRAYIAESDLQVINANRLARAIMEALPYPIYIVDESFGVKMTNPMGEKLSAALGVNGALPSEVRKQIDVAAGQGVEQVGDDVRRAITLEIPDDAGAANATKTRKAFIPQVFRLSTPDQTARGWAVLMVDVTRLWQLDEAKTKAIAVLGHEVKTPVTSIRMTLHLLLEEKIGLLNEDQRELVKAGRDDCERLLKVLQALLELARFESGRTPLRMEPHQPSELLADAKNSHLEVARHSGNEIEFDVEPGLPLAMADPVHVSRVLSNFLSNACKYATPGTPIQLKAQRREDGFARLSIVNRCDRPLTETEQAQVFDPFFRRSGETAEGSGLGLAIAREIALAHRGRIGVFSQADAHTVEFFIDLRLAAKA